jgi:hypothetical protein
MSEPLFSANMGSFASRPNFCYIISDVNELLDLELKAVGEFWFNILRYHSVFDGFFSVYIKFSAGFGSF